MKTVIVIQHGNWYSFSPTGHANYNRDDEIKCHGLYSLLAAMHANSVRCAKVSGYNVNGTFWKPEDINAFLKQIY